MVEFPSFVEGFDVVVNGKRVGSITTGGVFTVLAEMNVTISPAHLRSIARKTEDVQGVPTSNQYEKSIGRYELEVLGYLTWLQPFSQFFGGDFFTTEKMPVIQHALKPADYDQLLLWRLQLRAVERVLNLSDDEVLQIRAGCLRRAGAQ